MCLCLVFRWCGVGVFGVVVCLFGLVVCGYLVLGRLCCVLDCFLFMVDL